MIVLVLAAAACGQRSSAPPPRSDAAPADAAPPVDAAAVDATPVDAGPATRELRGAVETFLTRLGKRDVAAIWDDAHADFRAGEQRRRAERMMVLLVEPLGKFLAIDDYRTQAGNRAGDNAALGTARFEHGVAPFQIVFRDDGDVPRLSFFNVDLPPELRRDETPEQARALADRALAGALTGDVDKLRRFAHPALDEKLDAAQAASLKELVGKLGKVKQIELVVQEECKGQCFELKVTGARATAKATLKLTRIFGRWHVLSFNLELT